MQMDDYVEIEILGTTFRANKIFIIIIINVVETLHTLQHKVDTHTHVLPLGVQK